LKKRKITWLVILLSPFTLLYWMVISVRNLLFDWEVLKSTDFRLPVLSVGNIGVGGTGKTPHVEYLVSLLKDHYRIATLSRGYRRKTRDFQLAGKDSTVRSIGDEPMQIRKKFPEITVAVDRNRVHGIRQLLKIAPPVEVIILDDAYQHRYVKPGKSILLFDYQKLVSGDFLLPAGRLREPLSARQRADIILITKCPERLKPIELRNIVKHLTLDLHQHLFFTTIEYGGIQPVFDQELTRSSEYFKKKKAPVLLVTAIANPRQVRKFARSISPVFHEITFPDHHNFSKRDIEKIEARIEEINHPDLLIVTTEKDAMRFREMGGGDRLKKLLYYVPIQVRFLNEDQEEFNQIIRNYVRNNQRDNILHKEQNKTES
jgi:tetraacyldisaccharide 4'-kinase